VKNRILQIIAIISRVLFYIGSLIILILVAMYALTLAQLAINSAMFSSVIAFVDTIFYEIAVLNGILLIGLYTYLTHESWKLFESLSTKTAFNKINTKKIKLIGVLLVVIPLTYTIMWVASNMISSYQISRADYLITGDRNTRIASSIRDAEYYLFNSSNIPASLQMNVSTVLLGAFLYGLAEVIAQGKEIKEEVDLTV
jgi:hypothetical protein